MAIEYFIQYADNNIALTEHGFLKNTNDWNEEVAELLAVREQMQLTPEHWQVIYFLREFYRKFKMVPPLRPFIKKLSANFGEAQGNSLYLHKLFPNSPMSLISKIAGLPRPKHCM